jgi:hypothetical protein
MNKKSDEVSIENQDPDQPWTIEADLLGGQKFKSKENIIDMIICHYLMAGDTRPLAWWLSMGHRPSDAVLQVIASMLHSDREDDEIFRFKLVGPEQKLRDLLIALSTQKLMQELGEGSYDSAIKTMAKWVGVSEAVAKKAYDKYSDV